MTYKEYLNAARKHLNACIILRDSLSTLCNSKNKDAGKIKQLTLSLYYLSGYIIECSVKYGIYVYLNYDKNADIKKLDTRGITFKKHIKHHKFDRYVDHLNKNICGIILIDNKNNISNEVKKLYDNWNTEIRYCYNEIPTKFKHCDDLTHVLKFSEHAEEVFKYIQANIR